MWKTKYHSNKKKSNIYYITIKKHIYYSVIYSFITRYERLIVVDNKFKLSRWLEKGKYKRNERERKRERKRYTWRGWSGLVEGKAEVGEVWSEKQQVPLNY